MSEGYFEAYDDVAVHELMIKDAPRMEAYARAVERAAPDIRGKVVVDVGCGTGILSLLCARAGARKVYAIEASGMAGLAEQIVEKNGMGHIVEVVHARIEDVELPEKADVLISEWMARERASRGSPLTAATEEWHGGRARPRPELCYSLCMLCGNQPSVTRPCSCMPTLVGLPSPARDDARERHRRPRQHAQAGWAHST